VLKHIACGDSQDPSNAQSIQDARRHADEFRKVAQSTSGTSSMSSPKNQQPPAGSWFVGLDQLDTELLGSLSLRLQDVFFNHGSDQDVIIVLGRVCSGLSQLAQHAQVFFLTPVTGPRRSSSLKLSDTRVYEPQIRARLGTTTHFCEAVVLKLRAVAQVYQNQLMATPFLLEGVTALLRSHALASQHSPEASAHAALLLSQVFRRSGRDVSLQLPSFGVVTCLSFDFPRWRVCELINKPFPPDGAGKPRVGRAAHPAALLHGRHRLDDRGGVRGGNPQPSTLNPKP